MTEKDKKAKQRVEDERELSIQISQLLRDFSEKYDVECKAIEVGKNDYYGRVDQLEQPPMYHVQFYWGFDYLGHPKRKEVKS